MRYEGNAPQYSAFAIVAIESVWPNPEGNELTPNDSDLDLLGASSEPYKSTVKPGMAPASTVQSEEDHEASQGYYKILPLNIVRLQTSSSVSRGSEFSVAFTLDDLLLVLPSGRENAFRYATGLPISRNDLVESDFPHKLPQLRGDGWSYVRDDALGLSRYRVSGPQSAFNIEDLVDVNDTVTIWIYHDPQDFYVKDGLPVFGADGLIAEENNEITGIVGSGDRQNQFSTGSRDFDETMLFNLGLVNDIVRDAVALSPEDSVDQINTVTRDNLRDVLLTMSQEAGTGVLPGMAVDKIKDYVDSAFPDAGDIERQYIVDILSILRRVQPIEEEIPEGELEQVLVAQQTQVNLLNMVVQSLSLDEDGNLVHPPDAANELRLRDLGFEDPGKAILSLNLIKNQVNEKAREYARNYLTRRGRETVSQTFTNGRKVLLNGAHGETPYLALKGTISQVTSAIGTTDGSHLVTISGAGYEKVLTSNQVFYEDMLFPEATFAPKMDYNTVYMNMSPPRAVQQIIARWAARQVIFGRPTSFSTLALNASFFLRTPMGQEETEEVGEENQNTFRARFPGQPDGYIPIRGTFVYANYAEAEGDRVNPALLRVFAPLNYLDSTRIREMSTVLDKAYRDPSVEAAINTAQMVNGGESIMNNLRRVGGVADFYEMFVDETGRFRYRLKFEAIERTPDTGTTPIVQDYDVLASGTQFRIDDRELTTVVSVRPILSQHVTVHAGLGFIGRSVPPAGELPLEDIEKTIPEESLAPHLFKYGLRAMTIQDLYTSERGGAERKAHLYRLFYGRPLKRATIRVRNNTSFRIGETVLVSLHRNKKRSRTIFDVPRMIEWLNFIIGDEQLLKMYVGVERRFLPEGRESYLYTRNMPLLPTEGLYNEFAGDPHGFVARAFLKTFQFLQTAVGEINVFTPEYFPTTYWYHERELGGFKNWDQGNLRDQDIIDLYAELLGAAALGRGSSRDALNQQLTRRENQGIINAIKFQDFRATSYYIEEVVHRFSHGVSAETVLNLNYGQDNLVLLEPRSLLPIGFISLEKKMRIGYPDEIQRRLWRGGGAEKSAIQNMYVYQYEEDKKFKEASFLHGAQYLRNSSNYMYELMHVHDPTSMGASFEPPTITSRRTLS